MVMLKLIFAVIYALVCLGIALFLHWDSRSYNLLIFLTLNQFLLSFILYLRSNLSALHLFKTDSLISVADRLIMIFICVFLLYSKGDSFTIEWFVYSQTVGYVLTAIISFALVYKQVQFFTLSFNWKFLVVILKQTYPYATLVLFMALYMRTDIVMLEQMLPDGKTQAGIYAQPFRIIDAVSIFAYLFSVQLLPIFSRMLKNKETVEQLVKLSYSVLIVPVLIFTICTFFYSEELMKTLYHEHHNISSGILKILVIGFIPIASTYVFGTLLTANKSLKALNIITGAGMVMNILLNIFLIPKYAALGAAIASLTTQLLTSCAQIIASKYVLKMKTDVLTIVKILSFSALLILSAIFVKPLFSSWLFSVAIVVVIGGVLAFVLKLLYIKDFLQILKTKKP